MTIGTFDPARARETAERIRKGIKPRPLFVSEAKHVPGAITISSIGQKAA